MLSPAAVQALQGGSKIEAIRIVRAERGCQLKDAKDLVDAYLESQPVLKADLEARSAAAQGILKWIVGLALLAGLLYLLAGCAAQEVKYDAFGRSPSEIPVMPPGYMSGCNRADFDEPPVIVYGPLPAYPVGRVASGHRGSATATFTVLPDGRLENISAKSIDSRWFSDHAVIALRDWKVEPARKKGVPVATSCTAQFVYVLRGIRNPE